MKVSTVEALRERLAGLGDRDLVAVDLWTLADLQPFLREAFGDAESGNMLASRDLLGCVPPGDWSASEDELTSRLVDNLRSLFEEGGDV
jgi:hypothetical protein